VFILLAAAMIVLGAALLFAGVRLLAVGGSFVYALTGVLLMASGVLHLQRKQLGFWLFALLSVATYVWSIWESGSNGWAYIPRLAWLIAVSFLWLACWSVKCCVCCPTYVHAHMLPCMGLASGHVADHSCAHPAPQCSWPTQVWLNNARPHPSAVPK
jgi:glucose dehydrogenase